MLEALVAAAGAVAGGLPSEGDTSPAAIATLLVFSTLTELSAIINLISALINLVSALINVGSALIQIS